MSIPYFYEPFIESNQIMLGEASMHHALHVLRMKVNDELYITNGEGSLVKCKITSITKRDCQIALLESELARRETTPDLHIAISFTKNPARIEWFLEKVTEIGIQQITPLITQRSEKIYWKKERFEKIMISAMLQSQQCFLPKLNDAAALDVILQNSNYTKYIAHCESLEDRVFLTDCLDTKKNTLIFIGPEGDFTKDEIHLCLQHQCKAVSLGSKRLRTETAGLFACVVFNAQIATI